MLNLYRHHRKKCAPILCLYQERPSDRCALASLSHPYQIVTKAG